MDLGCAAVGAPGCKGGGGSGWWWPAGAAGLLWCVAGLLDMEEMWQPSREGGGAAKGLGYGARPSREKGEALEEICGSKEGDLAGGTRPWCGVCAARGGDGSWCCGCKRLDLGEN